MSFLFFLELRVIRMNRWDYMYSAFKGSAFGEIYKAKNVISHQKGEFYSSR